MIIFCSKCFALTSDPKTFSRIDMLMDHAEHRAATANTINFQMAKVINQSTHVIHFPNVYEVWSTSVIQVILLLKESSYLPDFGQSDVQRMIGIIRTNGMKLESHRYD